MLLVQHEVCLLNKFSSVVHPVFPVLGTKIQIGSNLKTCGNVDHYLLVPGLFHLWGFLANQCLAYSVLVLVCFQLNYRLTIPISAILFIFTFCFLPALVRNFILLKKKSLIDLSIYWNTLISFSIKMRSCWWCLFFVCNLVFYHLKYFLWRKCRKVCKNERTSD